MTTELPVDPCRLVRQVNEFCEQEGHCKEPLHLPDKSARDERATLARARPDRRGTTTAEMAIVLIVFLTCVLGMLDLGMAVFRYHLLAEASRQGARLATVHGKLAERLGPWGPTGFTVSGDDAANPLAAGVRPLLAGLEAGEITIEAQWPDAGNDPIRDHRVRVTVRSTYNPVTLFLFGASISLQASSTMVITH
jgi:hypothetical protein